MTAYTLTKLTREQWLTLRSLVEQRRYALLRDPYATQNQVDKYEAIAAEIIRTMDATPELRGEGK